jgi:hypothetical protein
MSVYELFAACICELVFVEIMTLTKKRHRLALCIILSDLTHPTDLQRCFLEVSVNTFCGPNRKKLLLVVYGKLKLWKNMEGVYRQGGGVRRGGGRGRRYELVKY